MKSSSSFGAARFAVVACLLLVVLYILTAQLGLVEMLNHANARVLHACLQVMGLPTQLDGDVVATGSMRLQIITECTGLYSMLILASAVLAFPAPVRAKVLGIAVGLPFVMLVNVGRLITLAFIGNAWPDLFHATHVYLWQVTLLLMIVCAWVVWARWAGRLAARAAAGE